MVTEIATVPKSILDIKNKKPGFKINQVSQSHQFRLVIQISNHMQGDALQKS